MSSNKKEPMKFGLTTFFRNNYGSILQCYATKKKIENKGYICTVLERNWDADSLWVKLKRRTQTFIKITTNSELRDNRKKMKKTTAKELDLLNKASQIKMEEFIQKEFSPLSCSWNELVKLGNDKSYAGFITGSDQVWNLSRGLDPFYFLEFVPVEKRICLAPSCGVNSLPSFNRADLKKKLKGFNRLSVREQTGARIINELIKSNVTVLSDPTLLMTGEEWDRLSRDAEIDVERDYYIVHFLNTPCETAIEMINKMATSDNKEVICIGYMHDAFMNIKNFHYVDAGPMEYLKYIRNADYIFTDSFHSTLFSINLHKEFFTFERQYMHSYSQISRVIDLLEKFDLSDRLVVSRKEAVTPIDWRKVDAILEKERTKLETYLQFELESVLRGR